MVLLNPLKQAGLAFRRDHTLGLLLERLAEVRGPTDLVEETDGGLTLTIAEAAHLVDTWAGAEQ